MKILDRGPLIGHGGQMLQTRNDLEFRILGPVQVLRQGAEASIPAPRQRAVLAALLLEPNRVVSVDRLERQLWGEAPPTRARNTIQSLVLRLRRALPAPVLHTRPPGYLIQVRPGELDLDVVREHAVAGATALTQGDALTAEHRLSAALCHWRGEPLAGVAGVGLAEVDVPRLQELHARITEDLIETRLMLHRNQAVIPQLVAMTAENPMRERPSALLMLALYRSGRQAEALRIFQQLRERFVDELGIEPTAAIQRLHQQILLQDSRLDRSAFRFGAPASP